MMNSLLLIWLLLLAGFSLVDKGSSRALQWPWHLYFQFWCLLPWVWLGLRSLTASEGLLRFGGLVDLGFGMYSLLQILATAWSGSFSVSLSALPATLAPVGISYVVLNLVMGAGCSEAIVSGARRRLLERGTLVFLLVFSLGSLARWLAAFMTLPDEGGHGLFWLLSFRNVWPLGHPNYTAGLAVFASLWAFGMVARERGLWRAASVAGGLIGLLLLVSSGSRAGLLALGAGLGVWSLRGIFTLAVRWRWAALGAGLLLGCCALLAVFRPEALRALGLGRSGADFRTSDLQRQAMLSTGLGIVRAEPWLGVGPGMVPRVYAAHRAEKTGGVESVIQLHSAPLQIAAEAGIPALFASLLLAASVLFRRPSGASLGVAAALLVYSLFDYQLDIPLLAAVSVLAASLVLAPSGPVPCVGNRLRLPFAVGILGLQACWCLAATPMLRGRAAFGGAMEAFFEGCGAECEVLFVEAMERDPGESLYPLIRAMILADPQGHGAPPTGIQQDSRAARVFFDACLAIDPGQDAAHFNRGWLLLRSEPLVAEVSFRKAGALNPTRGLVHLGLGLALYAQGREKEALDAFARELANNPAYASSPAWSGGLLAPVASASRRASATLLRRAAALAQGEGSAEAAAKARSAAAVLEWLEDPRQTVSQVDLEPAQAAIFRWLAGGEGADLRGSAALLARSVSSADSGTARTFLESRLGSGPAASEILAACREGRRAALPQPGALPANFRLVRYQRLGYGLLMRNLDAPVPKDLCTALENAAVREFLPELFPAKGAVPPSLLDRAAQAVEARKP